MKSGDLLDVVILALASDGTGAVPIGERTLHVPGAAPGDALRVRIDAIARQRPLAFATAVEVVERGAAFENPDCHHAAPVRGDCGGCAIMHIAYDAQLAAKRQWVRDELGELAPDITVRPAPSALGYRNRGNFTVWRSKDGLFRYGSRRSRSAEYARMDGCRVLAGPLSALAETIAENSARFEVPLGDEPGGLRHFSLRIDTGGRILVELITSGDDERWIGPFSASLLRLEPVTGVSRSINTGTGSAIRVEPPELIVGRSVLRATLAGVEFPLESDAFFQLNYAVADRMVRRAIELVKGAVGASPGPIWDLYSGVGALGVPMAQALGRPLFAADSVAAAISGAKAAAEAAGVTATTLELDLAHATPDGWPDPAAVVVDPPRKGLSPEMVARLSTLSAPLLYMSCSAHTFARDARALVATGRTLRIVEAYDMLPQTPHVELLALFDPPTPSA